MNNFKYPKSNIIASSRSQYWEDPHSMIVTNGGNGYKSSGQACSGNGSVSLGKQNSSGVGVGFCVVVIVVEIVEGPVYTHSLQCEFSYLYKMIKGVFH